MSAVKDSIDPGTVAAARALEAEKYKHGFITDLEQEFAPAGLNEEIVRFISAKKNEPDWMLAWRLEAFQRWQTMEEPTWALVRYPAIDYQAARYYAAPKSGAKYQSIEDVEPEILETYKKLGIPLKEAEVLLGVEGAAKVAVDAVFDSVSVVTTFGSKAMLNPLPSNRWNFRVGLSAIDFCTSLNFSSFVAICLTSSAHAPHPESPGR
jgi:Fe-S cluster assembly protein SufB